MKNSQYYNQQLRRPRWAPPSWLFAPVWTFLYLLIAVSFATVFIHAVRGTIPFIVALPFVLNLVFNFLFTPIQFGLKNNYLALLDVLLTLGTLAWALIVVFPYLQWVSYINIPYLLWTSFATVLQLTITILNR